MPADVWAVTLAVGTRPTRKRSPSEWRGSAVSESLRTRTHAGRMAGQERRIDDTILIREAQRGNRAASRNSCVTTIRRSCGWRCTSPAPSTMPRTCIRTPSSRPTRTWKLSLRVLVLYWIYRIVTNLCLDHLRKKTVRKEDAPVATDASGGEYSLLDQVPDGPVGGESGAGSDAAAVGRRESLERWKINAEGAHGV